MRLPKIQGIIERRILANYRVDPACLRPLLPAPCVSARAAVSASPASASSASSIRPHGLPAALGVSSENAAHRIAIEWDDAGQTRRGVYIPRRDTSSRFNVLAGGRLFAGLHHHARFTVDESADHFHVALASDDGDTRSHHRCCAG